MKRQLSLIFAIFLATLFFASCASNQIEKSYTEEELLLSNLETIQKSIDENPVKTLYDFILLEEKQIENLLWEENLELVSSIENQILEEIKNQTEKYIAEKNFYQAKINVESLQTVLDFGIQFENQLSWMEDVKNQIDTWITSEIEAFLVKNQDKNPTVPEMITGTVTVWVDKGLRIEKSQQYDYQHLAYNFLNNKVLPLLVSVDPQGGHEEISTNIHMGQEFDYCLEGRVLIRIDGKDIILEEGDSIYYDSSYPHGMAAIGEKSAKVLTIVI